MREILKIVSVILLLLGLSIPVGAEDIVFDDSLDVAPTEDSTVLKQVDTLLFNSDNVLADASDVSSKVNFEKHLIQNPTKALFKSMVVPGWGQFGNRKYIKGLVMLGMDVWMISSAIKYKNEASDYWKLYENSEDVISRNYYYDLYDEKRTARNKYTWFAVIVSFVSMFDAYVDAHLSGMPTKENEKRIGFDVDSDRKGGGKISLTYSF